MFGMTAKQWREALSLIHIFGLTGLSFTAGLRLDYEKMKMTYDSGTAMDYTVGIKGEMVRGGQVIKEIPMMPETALTVQSRYHGSIDKDYLQLLPKFALQTMLADERFYDAERLTAARSSDYPCSSETVAYRHPSLAKFTFVIVPHLSLIHISKRKKNLPCIAILLSTRVFIPG